MLCVATAACDAEEPPPVRRPQARPTTTPAQRVAPKTPRVVIESTGRTGALLATGVRDLKAVGLWPRLTDHLYGVELDSRSGRGNVPEDGHLADAYFTGTLDDGSGGLVCDIMFFPSAVASDLARWREYYAGGLLAEQPPTVRGFYGALLAHELAHCRRGPRGEAVARAAEDRALQALRAAGI